MVSSRGVSRCSVATEKAMRLGGPKALCYVSELAIARWGSELQRRLGIVVSALRRERLATSCLLSLAIAVQRQR